MKKIEIRNLILTGITAGLSLYADTLNAREFNASREGTEVRFGYEINNCGTQTNECNHRTKNERLK